MTYSINAHVAVEVVWNDSTNEWEVPDYESTGTLEFASPATIVSDDDHSSMSRSEQLERASAHDVTADDLARMLGSALTQVGPNVNLQAGYRPASKGLVHMIEGVFDDVLGDSLGTVARAKIVQGLTPIFASVDQNAHLRGRAEGLAAS